MSSNAEKLIAEATMRASSRAAALQALQQAHEDSLRHKPAALSQSLSQSAKSGKLNANTSSKGSNKSTAAGGKRERDRDAESGKSVSFALTTNSTCCNSNSNGTNGNSTNSNSNSNSNSDKKAVGESESSKRARTAVSLTQTHTQTETASTAAPTDTQTQTNSLSQASQTRLVAELQSSRQQLEKGVDLVLRHLLQDRERDRERHAVTARLARGQREDRLRTHFRDSLQGKAVVLSNAAMQRQAATSEKRQRRKTARIERMSQRKMKKAKLLDPFSLPSQTALSLLRQHWSQYAETLSLSCGSDAQLQARLLGLDLCGATVQVLQHAPLPLARPRSLTHTESHTHEEDNDESENKDSETEGETAKATKDTPRPRRKSENLTGVRGTVTAASAQSVYIAVDTDNVSTHTGKTKKETVGERVVRVDRDQAVLAVFLPFVAKRRGKRGEREAETVAVTDTVAVESKSGKESDRSKETGKERERETEGEKDVGGEEDAQETQETQETMEAAAETQRKRGKVVLLYGRAFRPFQHALRESKTASEREKEKESPFVASKARHMHTTATQFTVR